MECCGNRPNRSDVHLSAEEETKIEQETREYFDTVVPKRHTKPQRSEHSNQYVDVLSSASTDSIPELTEFQRLEHDDPQKLVYSGSKVGEEFVETEYYKDLNCVDKQHHTVSTIQQVVITMFFICIMIWSWSCSCRQELGSSKWRIQRVNPSPSHPILIPPPITYLPMATLPLMSGLLRLLAWFLVLLTSQKGVKIDNAVSCLPIMFPSKANL